jgi:hypothetical protein
MKHLWLLILAGRIYCFWITGNFKYVYNKILLRKAIPMIPAVEYSLVVIFFFDSCITQESTRVRAISPDTTEASSLHFQLLFNLTKPLIHKK